ncbi:hypothetical protein GCM10023170_017790 [Phytohabitans houttuyneae]|uniref:Uncharacterized protein n=1 Tax=Phytohabitans houttuyneae TaxID=1076126 RepID=A0A6V8KVD1_9ACTN|nr:hypothetical protein Phou_099660 [Phytohabitans houttuyneae]
MPTNEQNTTGSSRVGPSGQSTPDRLPADNDVATRPSAIYVVLTTQRAGSGLVFGGVSAVAEAELIRQTSGAGARGALVAAYVRMADALVPVEVEADELPRADGGAYRVRTWLDRQLLGEHDVRVPKPETSAG